MPLACSMPFNCSTVSSTGWLLARVTMPFSMKDRVTNLKCDTQVMFDRQAAALNSRFYFGAFAVLTAIGFLAPIRVGDLPGYDDARYTLVAKQIVLSGDWLNTQFNGAPDFEHPPLLE